MGHRKILNKSRKWIHIEDQHPISYDMVRVLYEDGQEQNAWWDNGKWDCLNRISKTKITHWKYNSKWLDNGRTRNNN